MFAHIRLKWTMFLLLLLVLALPAGILGWNRLNVHASTPTQQATGVVGQAFATASQQSGVPVAVLKAICYMEGRLSNHHGQPSVDGGYGCMHLIKNKRGDTLDSAAKALGVSVNQLKTDMPTNIRGGASVLRADALALASNHQLPTSLADWYAAIEQYSNSTTSDTASMYADAVFNIINTGFSAPTETGEIITLPAQNVVKPHVTARIHTATALPQGCVKDNKTDYPGAIDCLLNPNTFDCNLVADGADCTYTSADRPSKTQPINFVAIHDSEGTLQDDLNEFQDVTSGVGIHYIVDTDGTVYQLIHDKDITYHTANLLYNNESIGIEHAGYDATGYLWYNAAQYLGSARLVAYLLKKYHLPLDHDHIVSHGTIPAAELAFSPNHVDPGPYWLWDYYLNLIHQQGVAFPKTALTTSTITLRPSTDQKPLGKGGSETPQNYNFFSLYTRPNTNPANLIPAATYSDNTDETGNVEPAMSYYYVAKAKDANGTGDTMYEIWYGEEDQINTGKPPANQIANAKLAWLAVPAGAGTEGTGTIVSLQTSDTGGVKIYGHPNAATDDTYVIGNAPNKSIFVSALSLTATQAGEGATQSWYEINFNHRQAWVPASEVNIIKAKS